MAEHNNMIFVYGMQRSGNHAIINWIECQREGKVLFLTGREPWLKDRQILVKKEAKKLKESYDLVIVSYEDMDLNHCTDKHYSSVMARREQIFGSTENRSNVIILRDPYNMFASRIQSIRGSTVGEYRVTKKINKKISYHFIEVWKKYAREFLQQTNVIDSGNKKVMINFNYWFSDIDYRKECADKLGLEFTDAGLNNVSNYDVYPSSFDGRTFEGRAQEMKVLDRWKTMIDDEAFKKVVLDIELMMLSEKIFGFGKNVVEECIND